MRFQRYKKDRYKLERICISFLVFLTTLFTVKMFCQQDVLAVTTTPQPIRNMYELMKDGNRISELSINESVKQEDHHSTKGNKVNELEVTAKSGKTVYLTFDDGPTIYTNEILALLDSYGMKGTFFMLEPNMRRYKSSLIEIIERGHSPALHGVTHDINEIYKSSNHVIKEMLHGKSTVNELTGYITTLIRTPYGSYPYMNTEYKMAVKEAGFNLWDWTVDSEDWRYTNGEFVDVVIEQLKQFTNEEKPIIILLHEKESTLEHLETLLEYLKENGYETRALTEKLSAYHF
ncbi:polysaccharide deacetylase family protein [Bacillus sp. 31A1R]|uniref:Polysaccharide deacetylase family protein n=1 Tax=Robertmurraya mangrovi TaxID=3098077 RepID=A0ABU5J2X4_9BACI|nr:polysaccharide deacetylase family protein [Bacillus sp. 31A1R]MDZ5473763.1 polysaccharide deacetylase family protein [Bacillus sp. 31A1R]